ncbi:MAG: hypothetical protein AAFZ67_11485 [Planctomycetota bacterium]
MNDTDFPIRTIYRFRFAAGVDMDEVNEAMELAVLAVESLRGTAEVRLDVPRSGDDHLRAVAIDGSFDAGREVAKVFVAFCEREFGPSVFRIDRIFSRGDIFGGKTWSAA